MISNYCVACTETSNLHNHHLVPRSKGGTDEETNLITLCGSCHSKIHNLDGSVWKDHQQLILNTKKAKKANGQFLGGVAAPYGYVIEYRNNAKYLARDVEEQANITIMVRLKDKGKSYAFISGVLADRGIKTRNGTPFAAMQIKRAVDQYKTNQDSVEIAPKTLFDFEV